MTDPRRTYRTLLAAVPHLIAVVPTVVLLTTAGDRLPDPIASHFGPSGVADVFTGAGALALMTAALGVGLALVFGASARFGFTTRAPFGSRWDLARWFTGISWATAAFVGVVLLSSVTANLDLADAAAAALPGLTFPLGVLAAVVAGPVGGLLAPRTPRSTADPAQVPAVPLGTTEQISWSRSVGAPWLPVAGGALVAGGLALAVTLQPVAGAAVALAGLAAVLLSGVRVVVDRRGLTVLLGLLGRPRVHIPAEDVAAVSVAHVSPMQFGGWGYRIVPGGSGVIIRSGQALVVTRRSGRHFTVTVDDAATAAGLLSAVATRTG
jgi:hypothetical protein